MWYGVSYFTSLSRLQQLYPLPCAAHTGHGSITGLTTNTRTALIMFHHNMLYVAMATINSCHYDGYPKLLSYATVHLHP